MGDLADKIALKFDGKLWSVFAEVAERVAHDWYAERILAIHAKYDANYGRGEPTWWCKACGTLWPCPTVRLVLPVQENNQEGNKG